MMRGHVRRLYTPWVRGVLLQCEVPASPLIVADERLRMLHRLASLKTIR
jgi:hypothetical protein